MHKILLAEDDTGISDFVSLELKHEKYFVITAFTGKEAIEKFEKEQPDLILLDIMMPEINGIDVLKKIRETSNIPIILLTAKNEIHDKVTGLNLGADDYISKPFEIEELIARMNAIFRRTLNINKSQQNLKNNEIELQSDNMKVRINNNEINLSKTEFMMLKLFLENQDKVLSRTEIINRIWGKDYFIDENTVDVYIGYLRSKISQNTNTEYIKTMRGSGYLMISK